MKRLMILLAAGVIAGVGLVACDDGGDGDGDGDGDSDVDTDVDTDVDGDTDTDVDGDSDSDTDADTDADGDGDGDGEVGSACSSDDDCNVPGECMTEPLMGAPSGYCTIYDCEDDSACGTGGRCVSTSTAAFCVTECYGAGDCRSGYECLALDEFSVCWINCDSDTQCTVTGHCEISDGQGFCSCGEGEHVDEDAGECVYDDCEFLDCGTLHMDCDDDGGCSGECAACSGCNPAGYTESTNHCYPPGAVWGGECETDADCPGTGMPGVDTFCEEAAGGFCGQYDGPDYVSEGAACTGDAGSVGVVFSSFFGEFTACLMGCSGGSGCRPGFKCEMAGTTEDIEVCLPVSDCETDSDCNDPSGALYCSESGSCYLDGCDPNPCASLANSDGECTNMENDYFCGCADGYYWVAETMTCDAFTCDATPVTPGSTTSGDTCTGTERYDAGGLGASCTGYSSAANELVYSLELPANTMVMVTMSAAGHDASLWATTSCADLGGAECVAGADDPEEMYVVNTSSAAVTYYIIADGYSGCGAFDLVIGATEAAPVCGNGDVEIGETCDDGNATDDDGCTACEVDFGYECDEAEPSGCTAFPVIGTFAPGAAIPDQTGGPLADGEYDYYLIEFTGDVLLDGTVTADAGDPDIAIVGEDGFSASHVATSSVETWTDDALSAGRYTIRIRAYSAFTTYTMNLSTTTP